MINPNLRRGCRGSALRTQRTYTWYLRLQEGAIVEAVAFFDSIEFNDFWTRSGT
jgi:ketosteroid isomerase-like protein